jgi:hypothetical protein
LRNTKFFKEAIVPKKQGQATKENQSTDQKIFTMTVKDRLLIGEFFPQKGNLITQLQAKDIDDKAAIHAEERKKINLRPAPNGGLTWEEKLAKDKDIVLTEAEVQFLKDQVERLNREAQFTQETAEVAQKIKKL